MLEDYLYEQNLHWQGQLFDAGTERELLTNLSPLMDIDHILAISGIRRCGKSFLMKQLINHLLDKGTPPENILFANLELPSFSGQPAVKVLDELWDTFSTLKNPKGKIYLFLDEIQTLQKWEVWVKYNYDLRKGDLKFVITGSNSHLLSSEWATLLTGRVIEKKLYPFSLREILQFQKMVFNSPEGRSLNRNRIRAAFNNYLQEGGMPELLSIEAQETKRELLTSYFNTIIYRDIVPRFAIRHSGLLKDLAIYLTGQPASLININKLADIFQSNRTILKEFSSFLQLSFLVMFLEKFDYSAKKRELALRKGFIVDNGFATFLPIRFSQDKGKLLENLVCVELVRRFNKVFYWKNHNECDFIIYDPRQGSQAIQVCYTLDENNRGRELAGLKAGCDFLKLKKGLILTFDQTDQFEYKNLTVNIVPVYQWLLNKNANFRSCQKQNDGQ